MIHVTQAAGAESDIFPNFHMRNRSFAKTRLGTSMRMLAKFAKAEGYCAHAGSVLKAEALRVGDLKLLWHPAGTDCSVAHPGEWERCPQRSGCLHPLLCHAAASY